MNIVKNILQSRRNNSGKKLDFIIVGAQKSGTTALYYYLRQHPEILFGKRKELHFFDNEELFRRKKPNYNILHNKMIDSSGHKISGECTPRYIYWAPSMRRIWEYNPQIKIIAILRNPVKRAYSQWNMYRNSGKTALGFEEYILHESELARESLPYQSRIFSCVDRGFYSEQLRRIFMFFRKEQVLILKYEYFKEHQFEVLNTILNFLEVDPSLLHLEEERINTANYNLEISQKMEQYLLEQYRNEIPEVERMLGWDCTDWKTPAKNTSNV